MSNLYDTLAQLRDENRAEHRGLYENEVFIQLISIAFNNELHPDELPQVFKIYNVMLYQEQMEALMKRIKLDVTVNLIGHTYSFGNNFEITQAEKPQG